MTKNICFKYRPNSIVVTKVPKVSGTVFTEVEQELGFDEIMPKLSQMNNWFPETSEFHHFLFLFERKNVCPVPFLRLDFEELIILQDQCERYSALPFGPGGTLDQQPAWIMEAFNDIVSSKNLFSRDQQRNSES
jgi:hypothetical protein